MFFNGKKINYSTLKNVSWLDEYIEVIERKSKKLIIPDVITEIGNMTFYYATSLESVSLSKNLTLIGSSAFRYCEKLKEIIIPEKVTEIKKYAFESCTALEKVTIPKNIILGDHAFSNCNLQTLTIPEGVTLGTYAFSSSPIHTVIFEGLPKELSATLFTSNKVNDLTIYCPWSKGEVPNAPWGATKATIIYDYTEEPQTE